MLTGDEEKDYRNNLLKEDHYNFPRPFPTLIREVTFASTSAL